MRVVTVATHSERYYPVLQEACKRHNVKLDVLGFEQKWQGFTWRLNLMNDYIQKLDDNEIVMFVDGFDTVIVQDVHVIEDTFKSFNKPLVFSYERESEYFMVAYGQRKLFGPIYDSVYISAGMYIGYVHALKQLYSKLREKSTYQLEADDQRIISELLRAKSLDFTIDVENKLFVNVFNGNHANSTIKLKDNDYLNVNTGGVIVNKKTGIPPCVIQGPGRTNINEVLCHLGYSNLIKDIDVSTSSSNLILWHIKNHAKYFIPETIIGLILVILIVYLLYVASRYVIYPSLTNVYINTFNNIL